MNENKGEKKETKKEKAKKKETNNKHFPLNARIKIINFDDEPELNGHIGRVKSKTRKAGYVKIVLQNRKETMRIPAECLELCPLPMSVIGEQAREYIAARVRMISACDEDQKSTDVSSIEKVGFNRSKRSSQMKGTEGGACTSSLLKILYDHHQNNSSPKKDLSFGDIVKDMRKTLHSRGYQQTPQLSSSRPMHLTTPWEFVPTKNFSGNRRALIIGIRYMGMPWELPGTHNDCFNMISFLKRFHGFQDKDFTILMDDHTHTPPTRANILKAFRKFASECQPHDAAYFHFSGHGGSVPDESGDETDGMDETLHPLDHLQAGEILDDEVYEEFILHLRDGVTLNAVVDSCHSGSVFDLPFELFGPGKGLDKDFSAVRFPHMEVAREYRRTLSLQKTKKKHLPINARIKIVNFDEEPSLNGFIGFVRSKPKKSSGRIKILFPTTTETMKIPQQCVKLFPLPMNELTKQAREYLSARVHLISASEDDTQLAPGVNEQSKSQAEGVEGGACTSAFLNILYDHENTNPDGVLKFGSIMKNMKQILVSRGQQQQPQLSSSRPVQLTAPWEFVPSKNFSGNRRALIIGVRYKGAPWELTNSHRDCNNMMKYLKRCHGFKENDFTILMDDDKHTPPTRANMLKAFRKFAFECRPNDAVYFHFAGHGGSVPDEGGDETDGMDETMYPMDYLTAGEILDDEVYEDFILHICSGVTLNAVVDSCHSGSVFDLPFELFSPGKGLDQDFSAVHFPHMEIA
eukprot:CAMPEP_0113648858 /NCGR_PEP_ID=MMETSP0017_2-20120614/25941_1 /TAXON_ID=2856 /ORGANISM="Cylindrotheca closterium" /LENGTH=746 /DNA_ID=CAMNT_0000561155 /DNA_START=110 /DNA_END=2346 /DNA_ORIENTATION=+ /assembly_acc=CAM_ASM_000147